MTDRDLFIAALDHADPTERAAWLDQACEGDSDRRRRVDILLRAHEHASRFLANPAGPPADPAAPDDPTRTAHPADDTAPATAVDALAFLTPTDKPGVLGKLDHFEVLEVVGKGGMGVVLKAFDPKLHRLVALKLMAPHLAAHGSARKRFEREARAVAAVKNEHVVAIYAVQPEGPVPYLVMEFIGGISLQDRLERHGPFEVKEILRIGMQTARGLAAAHAQGIVHRDIKPANILLENGVERVKLTDFGLARATDDANLTQSGMITGTPNYMSPEQAAGTTVDARSDLFSLGSVLYALCTGHPPFRAETPLAVLRRVADDPVRPPREANPDVPDWLDAIVRKLLAKNPADRFQTATEVAELLGQHLAHLQQPSAVPMPAPVGVAGTGERVWRQIFEAVDRDRRLWQHGMILTGLLLVGLAAVITLTAGTLNAILFAPAVIGLALIAVGGSERQRWDVPYKGRTIRFENSPYLGERLYVDGVRIARGGFGFMRELRGTVPDGPGAGDEVRALCEAGFLQFKCRISVSEGGPSPAAPVAPAALGRAAAAGGGAEPSPTVAPTSPAGFAWLVAIGLVAVPALLFWTQEEFWAGYFRPGYVAPVSMLVTSGLFLAVLWWCRRQSEPRWYRLILTLAMAAVVGGTLVGLIVSWGEGTYLDRLGEASTGHIGGIGLAATLVIVSALVRAVRWLATRSTVDAATTRSAPPAPHGPTAFALGLGFLVLLVGIVVSLFVRALVTPEGGQARTLAFLMGLWSAAALLAFGPGVFIARRWWRKRLPEERRADRRAAILAGLGVGMTILTVVLIIVRTPALREGLFQDPSAARLSVHWDQGVVDRVRLSGALAHEFIVDRGGDSFPIAPGRYVVSALKGGREVYREEFNLAPGGHHAVTIFETPLPGSDYVSLRVDCTDPTVTVTVAGETQSLEFPRAGSHPPVTQALRQTERYRLGVWRGDQALHTETIALKENEHRELRIPPVVLPERTVELKPKAGSFPADAVRMQLSPDRSAVAVERFDGPILVFDAATGRERFRIDRPQTHCTAFGFTPDSKRLAYLNSIEDGREHVLRVVGTADGKPVGRDLKPPPERGFFNSHALAFSPDGSRLAVSIAHATNPEPGNPAFEHWWESRVLRWELTADGDGPQPLESLGPAFGQVTTLRFTADGSELLAVCDAYLGTGWSWDTGKQSRQYPRDAAALDLVAVGKSHQILAGWFLSQAIIEHWWPIPAGEPVPELVPTYPTRYGSLALSPDDGLIAAGTKGGRPGLPGMSWEQLAAIRVLERQTGRARAVLLGHTDWPLDLAFTPDAKELISAGKDGTVRHWRLP
ncbi:MAG TPA: protein kinase [Gemmataceae bacterium]|nr:protein kinase [Gemmataceae bacterium]